ncbi:DUF7007 domain-containing protein [Sinorhizobium psoraleae]|uniref:DUF7007 domain-containing protein n=1 Tax=Sinorhizobium psoraleae TaxID=520838 RepID=UPI00289D4068|nr:hypothetical protein [Sinorhizobium psoraleae]
MATFRPLSDLKREDFYGHDGGLENEAAFRARVLETAQHKRELTTLPRIQTRMCASTPWGMSQLATVYAEGVVSHSTSSHGGFHLSSDLNKRVDAALRADGGWYEEDAEWAIVAITFPDLFTSYERKCADEIIQNNWPNVWERTYRRELAPGESWAKDRAAFDGAHADDWIVVSAIYSDHHPDMTEVIATRGGKRDGQAEEMRFLVPRAEYAARDRFGFVIDPVRHAHYEGLPVL